MGDMSPFAAFPYSSWASGPTLEAASLISPLHYKAAPILWPTMPRNDPSWSAPKHARLDLWKTISKSWKITVALNPDNLEISSGTSSTLRIQDLSYVWFPSSFWISKNCWLKTSLISKITILNKGTYHYSKFQNILWSLKKYHNER